MKGLVPVKRVLEAMGISEGLRVARSITGKCQPILSVVVTGWINPILVGSINERILCLIGRFDQRSSDKGAGDLGHQGRSRVRTADILCRDTIGIDDLFVRSILVLPGQGHPVLKQPQEIMHAG